MPMIQPSAPNTNAPAAQPGQAQGPEPAKPKGLFEALIEGFQKLLGIFGLGGNPSANDQFSRGPDPAQQGIQRNQVPANPRPQLQPPR